jgi:hypothetical protein
MKAYIVTEGEWDRSLLQHLLPPDVAEDVTIVTAGGGSGAVSMARSLLVRRQAPVALVVDADSISPALVRERALSLRELLRSVSVNTPAEVFLAVPEMGVVFFQSPGLLERILGVEIPDTLSILAEARPKEALGRLFADHKTLRSMPQMLGALTLLDLEELRKTKLIAGLNEFLRHALSEARTGASHG